MKDYFGYEGKTCVVTGASSGMGKAVASMLIDLGATVYGLDRNESDNKDIHFLKCDLSRKESIDDTFSSLPSHIDSFFGVAGLSGARTGYWTTFTVNFIANKYITETYLEKRMKQGDSILFVTSTGGLMWEKWQKEYKKVMKCKTWEEMVAFMKKVSPKDGVGIMAYSLSKRALNYYTALKAVELGKKGIRVNAVLPGSTDTGMKAEFEKMAGGKEKLISENGSVGRLATAEEMAEPIVFLNSSMANFISGEHLIVDSGHHSEVILGYVKNQMDVPVALKFYNTKYMQNILKKKAQ